MWSIRVPEPLHCRFGKPGAIGEFIIRASVEIGVRHRIKKNLVADRRSLAFFGEQRQRDGHITANAIAGHGKSSGVETELFAMLGNVFKRCIRMLDLAWKLDLWGERVIYQNECRIRAVDQ